MKAALIVDTLLDPKPLDPEQFINQFSKNWSIRIEQIKPTPGMWSTAKVKGTFFKGMERVTEMAFENESHAEAFLRFIKWLDERRPYRGNSLLLYVQSCVKKGLTFVEFCKSTNDPFLKNLE